MRGGPGLLCPGLLLCFILLGGCAAKQAPSFVAGRFPDAPLASLAATPQQRLSGGREFASVAGGGWGYARADAFVLGVPPEHRHKSSPTIFLESRLVRARNELEFRDSPPAGQRFLVTDYGTVSRTLSIQNGRMYSIWRGRVTLVPETPGFAATASRTVSREYWFDITDAHVRKGGAIARNLAAAP